MKRRPFLTCCLALCLLYSACIVWVLRPLPPVRESQQIGDKLYITERSRTYRLLPLREWGFQSDGEVGCGFMEPGTRCTRHETVTRIGFFEVSDVCDEWSQPLPMD